MARDGHCGTQTAAYDRVVSSPLSSDRSTNALFERAAIVLQRLYEYSPDEADALMRERYR
ncbi:MAG: hypothetical protein GC189_11730 [Alphaproteobacteria bacterium]|nr:hypothetical protein [Alphaproteobacteria bacterium]